MVLAACATGQAGVTEGRNGELHIRGGRSEEVVYMVDGMALSDVYSGEIAVEVDADRASVRVEQPAEHLRELAVRDRPVPECLAEFRWRSAVGWSAWPRSGEIWRSACPGPLTLPR